MYVRAKSTVAKTGVVEGRTYKIVRNLRDANVFTVYRLDGSHTGLDVHEADIAGYFIKAPEELFDGRRTPGEWKVTNSGAFFTVTGADNHPVAFVYFKVGTCDKPSANETANAKAIAAVPQMIECLKEFDDQKAKELLQMIGE